jgi:SAM-dependent methyltransferase
VVFLSQLVHHFTDEQNRELLRRIARALKPGGVSVLLDAVRPSAPEDGGGIGAVLDLYFAATSHSGTWPLETMQSWQRDAGLAVEQPLHLRTLPVPQWSSAGDPWLAEGVADMIRRRR